GGAAWPDHGADGAPCRPLPHAAAGVLGAARCPPCLPRCGRPGAVSPARGATRTLVAGRGSGGPVLSAAPGQPAFFFAGARRLGFSRTHKVLPSSRISNRPVAFTRSLSLR